MRSSRTRHARGAPSSRATKELLARMLWNLLVSTLFVLLLLWIIMGTTVVLYIAFGVLAAVIGLCIYIGRMDAEEEEDMRVYDAVHTE